TPSTTSATMAPGRVSLLEARSTSAPIWTGSPWWQIRDGYQTAGRPSLLSCTVGAEFWVATCHGTYDQYPDRSGSRGAGHRGRLADDCHRRGDPGTGAGPGADRAPPQ